MRELLEYVRGLERRIGALERQERSVPVVAIYERALTQNVATATSVRIDFDTEVVDTHDAVTTGASWTFTAPVAGTYHVEALLRFETTTTWAESERAYLYVYKNGSPERGLDWRVGLDSSGGTLQAVGGAGSIALVAGDAVDIRVVQTSGGTLTIGGDADFNRVSIFRIH